MKENKEKTKESQALFVENEEEISNNPEEAEIDFAARRKEVLNSVLEKLIDKINEPVKEVKPTKHRLKQPKKGKH